jgi:hypothetical protein
MLVITLFTILHCAPYDQEKALLLPFEYRFDSVI